MMPKGKDVHRLVHLRHEFSTSNFHLYLQGQVLRHINRPTAFQMGFQVRMALVRFPWTYT